MPIQGHSVVGKVGGEWGLGKESGQRWLKMEENGVKWGLTDISLVGSVNRGFLLGGGGIRVSRYS